MTLPDKSLPLTSVHIPVHDTPSHQAAGGAGLISRFASSDMDAVRDRMYRSFRPHVIRPRDRSRHQWRFELDELAISKEVVMSRVTYNREVSIEAPPLDEFFILQFTLRGACETRQGKDRAVAAPGRMCILNPTRPIRQHMDGAYSQIAVKISSSLLEQNLAGRFGYELPRRLEFLETAQPLVGSLRGLANIFSSLWSDISAGQSCYHLEPVQQGLHQTISALLLSAFPHNFSDQIQACDNKPGPAPYFVRRAERFICDNAHAPISLRDILEDAGVSQRTLQIGFRRFRGTTPMAYLKKVRLEMARRALLRSVTTRKSVTEIALECGFTHLSKFAQDYRCRYRELPSETARRAYLPSV